MKKLIVVLALVLVVGLTATFAYAQTPTNSFNFNRGWHEDRMEWNKSQVEEALEEGLITEEEAEDWEDHFNYMEEFHRENRFTPRSGCHGYRNGNGFGQGMMMRGNRWGR